MSTTTYLELCQQTQKACGISGNLVASVTGQTGMLANLVRWVADADVAIQRVATNWDFLYQTDFTVDTVQGSSEYTKPLILGAWDRSTFYVDYTTVNNAKLVEIPYRAYFNTFANGVQTQNKPTNFVLAPNDNLTVYPVPDAVYALTAHYWRTALRMTDNSDVSLIPENYIRAIIARAKMYYGIDQEATDVYNEAFAEYERVLLELKYKSLPGYEFAGIDSDVQMTVSTDGFGADDNGYFY